MKIDASARCRPTQKAQRMNRQVPGQILRDEDGLKRQAEDQIKDPPSSKSKGYFSRIKLRILSQESRGFKPIWIRIVLRVMKNSPVGEDH
jgi:hypothetical protein